jgi:rhomboid protease GluP
MLCATRRFIWPVATCAGVALNLAAWCAVAWVYGLSLLEAHNSALLLRAGAVNGELLRAGEWWRLVSSQFLHVHFPHVIFNLLALTLLGAMLEREMGAWRVACLYVGSGLVGQLVGVAATPALVSSGASQAVMGLAGATAFGLFRRPEGRNVRLTILLAFVAVQVALDVATAGYVKAGHVGGFGAGALLAYALRRADAGEFECRASVPADDD